VFNYETWNKYYSDKQHCFPIVSFSKLNQEGLNFESLYFVDFNIDTDELHKLLLYPKAVVVISCPFDNKTQVFRSIRCELDRLNIKNPIVFKITSDSTDLEQVQLNISSDLGIQLIDGFGDGLWINAKQSLVDINSLSFGILQATRTRISKTEYISCPSCGRTLFDLQETTQKIRKETSHLKGLKIGIMGCIVNGPGEMADADYGYVGTGPGKITLYKEKTVVRKNVAEDKAVEELINLIKEHGDWIDLK
jgi:(E)-4-hydroxy-3-methylbut-2-enyl-diphosphate synthase